MIQKEDSGDIKRAFGPVSADVTISQATDLPTLLQLAEVFLGGACQAGAGGSEGCRGRFGTRAGQEWVQ